MTPSSPDPGSAYRWIHFASGRAPLTAYARKILAACDTPPPAYGTTDWEALPVGDYGRLVALVVAAECWRGLCGPEPDFTMLAIEREVIDGA